MIGDFQRGSLHLVAHLLDSEPGVQRWRHLLRIFFGSKAAATPPLAEADALYGAALEAYERKDLGAAIPLFDRVIALQPDHAGAYYKRGNSLKDLGQFPAALASYDHAVRLKPDFAYAWCNRGVVQQALALNDAALASYDHAIALEPGDALAHSNRALLLQGMSRWESALASHDRALALDPKLFQVWFHRGNVLGQLQRPAEALLSYEKAVKCKPDYAEAHYNRAVLLERCGRHREALSSYDAAVAIFPGFHQAHFNRAGLLKRLTEHDAALAGYDRAIAAKPDYAEAFSNRGVLLQERGRLEEALASYERAIAIRGDYAEAYFNRGTLLRTNEQFEAALASFDRALAIKPDYAAAYCDRAWVLLEVGRLQAALVDYDRATALQPDFAEANFNRSQAQLLHGDYKEGWRGYEWRWKNADRLKAEVRTFDRPLWLGEHEIAGKTLLVYCEQGLGDTLQFCRFTKPVAELGAKVVLEVQLPLVRLLEKLDGVSRTIPEGSVAPPFDYHCPLLSLPLALNITLDNLPAPAAYLHSDAAKVAKWQTRLGPRHRPRIGLAWSGNPNNGRDRNRSVRLADLVEHLPGEFQYICLQKELRPADRVILDATPDLLNFSADLHDFSDTAALCDCVDLVISVCTSIAHLGAGLGKHTWVLLHFNADWRWLKGRDDSPWYPTAKLYRQPTRGDWPAVFARVGADLRRLFGDRLEKT